MRGFGGSGTGPPTSVNRFGRGRFGPSQLYGRMASALSPSVESPHVLLQKLHGAFPREARAGRVKRGALVATEAVASTLIDVHRHLGLGGPDRVPVVLGDGLVGLAEVQQHRTLRRLVGELGHGTAVVAAGGGAAGHARGREPGR